eukprot:scaffold12.g8085.t1
MDGPPQQQGDAAAQEAGTAKQQADAAAQRQLLEAIKTCDLRALEALLAAPECVLECEGVPALAAAVLAGWEEAVPALAAADGGGSLNVRVPNSRLLDLLSSLGGSLPARSGGYNPGALEIAAWLGHAGIVQRLLAAGANLTARAFEAVRTHFQQMWGTSSVPAVFEALIRGARGLPAGPVADAAHLAAAQLAWPEQGERACPRPLQRLLELHRSSEQFRSHSYSSAVEKVLGRVALSPNASADARAWLAVPAVQEAPLLGVLHSLVREALQVSNAKRRRRFGKALAVLLRRRRTWQAVLAAAEEEGSEGEGSADAELLSRLLITAAWACRGDLVNRLLAAGARITMTVIREQLPQARVDRIGEEVHVLRVVKWDDMREARAALHLLLRRHAPHVRLEGARLEDCPVCTLLLHWHWHLGALADDVVGFGLTATEVRDLVQERHFQHLRTMELLVSFGYQPAVFRSVRVRQEDGSAAVKRDFDPRAPDADWEGSLGPENT